MNGRFCVAKLSEFVGFPTARPLANQSLRWSQRLELFSREHLFHLPSGALSAHCGVWAAGPSTFMLGLAPSAQKGCFMKKKIIVTVSAIIVLVAIQVVGQRFAVQSAIRYLDRELDKNPVAPDIIGTTKTLISGFITDSLVYAFQTRNGSKTIKMSVSTILFIPIGNNRQFSVANSAI
jgi:hypothetical protein